MYNFVNSVILILMYPVEFCVVFISMFFSVIKSKLDVQFYY